jgi:methionyl-tRNA formyltransferase
VDEGIDTGDVVGEARFPLLPDDTFADVSAKVLEIFPSLLVKVLTELRAGKLKRRVQGQGGRYYRKRNPEDGRIHWKEMDALAAHNFVRALSRPAPGAFTMLGDRKIVLWSAAIESETLRATPGRVLSATMDGFVVATALGTLKVSEYSTEGEGPRVGEIFT